LSSYNLLFREDISLERAKAFAESIGAVKFVNLKKSFKFATIVAKESVILRLAERTDIFEAIEQDQVITIDYKKSNQTTNGRQTGATWGLDRVDQRNLPLDGIYNYPDQAGSGVTVYVIDTGILSTHNDVRAGIYFFFILKKNFVSNLIISLQFGGRATLGPNFHDSAADSTDDNGHGTHCAGTIGGTTYGLAKQVSLIGIKVLGRLGSGSLSNVAAGVSWAAEDNNSGKGLASMSLGGSVSTVLDRAVEAAIADGLAVIAASGNSDADGCDFSPAHVASISVNAADDNDDRASFSNFGSCTDIFAPGVDITSTWIGSNSATNTISGTSMACPHVAGAAALLLGSGSYTPTTLAAAVLSNATPNVVGDVQGSPNRLLYSPY